MNHFSKYFTSLLVTLSILTFFILPLAYATDLPLDQHTVDSDFRGAYAVYVADMDGDGDLDILSAAWGDQEFAWWENSAGDGSSWIKRTVATSSNQSRSVYAADINGDGLQDLLGAAFSDGISWWQNDGTLPDDGSAWTRHVVVDRTNFEGAAVVRAADVDQDGDIDILGASTLNAFNSDVPNPPDIAWWENTTGDGTTWIQHSVDEAFTAARSVYTADVDDDGDLDIIGASRDLSIITWWEASPNGNAISWTRHNIDSSVPGATGVSTADVDGDGDDDVLGTSKDGNYISWWENDGTPSDGEWVEHRVVNNFEEAWTTYAFDMDQDGDLDILGVSRGDIADPDGGTTVGSLRWWENASGDGTTLIEHVISDNMPEARWIYPADFDQDGQLDLVGTAFGAWSAGHGGRINWWQNSTIHRNALYPITNTITSSALGIRSLYPIDLNKDGSLDILTASADDNTIGWYENDGASSPAFTSHIISTAALSATALFAADLDLDGDIDLLSASADDDKIAWYESDGNPTPTFTPHTLSTTADGASAVYAADLDSDGDFDVISASANDDTIAWYENGGAGASPTFTQTVISSTADGVSALYVADLNRDGHLDLLSASANDNTIRWYEHNGAASPAFTAHDISTNALAATAVYAIDMDADGDIDVLSASAGDNKVAWYENNGSATSFSEHSISTTAAGASAVYALDADLDGDIDVLAASKADDTLLWYESDGSSTPTFTTHTISTSADGAAAIYGADINGDGKPDLLSASEIHNQLNWYPNLGGQFSLVTTDTAPVSIPAGEPEDIFKITATHNGRTGDHKVELVTLELLLEEVAASPLSSQEANSIIENLYIYLDDGSGSFEALIDTAVITVSTLALTDGIQTVTFTDDDPNVEVSLNTPRSYFVVVELTANADEQATDSLRITHITESSSSARDADAQADIPLTLAYAANVSSSQSNISAPLAVTLGKFSAMPTQEHTLITWQTVLEAENLGFNLYKGVTPHAPEKRLNDALIASQAPGSGQGANYQWQDDDIEFGSTSYYWLEAVSTNNTTTLHGPISATTNIPTAISISELNAKPNHWPSWIALILLVVTALAVQIMPPRVLTLLKRVSEN